MPNNPFNPIAAKTRLRVNGTLGCKIAMTVLERMKSYIGATEGPRRFIAVDPVDLRSAEMRLGTAFPASLRTFYLEVGYGWYASDKDRHYLNLIVHPLSAVDLLKGTSEFGPPEPFLAGDLPVFDSGWNRFLVMRPFSKSPDAVFRDDGCFVADSFTRFVELLLVDTTFYARLQK